LLFSIEGIRECGDHIAGVTAENRKATVEAKRKILDERLRFVEHKARIMLWKIEFVTKRTQAQMAAVSTPLHSISLVLKLVDKNRAAADRDRYITSSPSEMHSQVRVFRQIHARSPWPANETAQQ